MELVPGVHLVDGVLGCNAYLLGHDAFTLVDPGLITDAGAVERYLRRLGRRLSDVTTAVLTHYHPDHAGALPLLYAKHPFKVAIHSLEAPYVEGRLPLADLREWGNAGAALAVVHRALPVRPVPVALPLNDGDRLDVLGGARVLHAPGHTAGSICLYLPERRLLFTGDALVRKPWGLSMAAGLWTEDAPLARRSLARTADLAVDTACFGHGKPLTHDAGKTLRAFFNRVLPELESA